MWRTSSGTSVSQAGGQAPRDRYALEYHLDTPVPEPWHEFIAELRGKRYRRALGRLLGVRRL
jgi:hypothetical protein